MSLVLILKIYSVHYLSDFGSNRCCRKNLSVVKRRKKNMHNSIPQKYFVVNTVSFVHIGLHLCIPKLCILLYLVLYSLLSTQCYIFNIFSYK